MSFDELFEIMKDLDEAVDRFSRLVDHIAQCNECGKSKIGKLAWHLKPDLKSLKACLCPKHKKELEELERLMKKYEKGG